MSERPDPFMLLQALRPATDINRLEVGELPNADAMLLRVLALPTSAAGLVNGRPRRRRWVVAAGVVTSSVVATSAAAAVLLQFRSSDREVLACYEAAASDADRFEMRIDAGDDPVAACSRLWTDGTFGTAGQPESRACSTSDGTTAVVPGDDVSACAGAGLEPIEPAIGDGATPDDEAVDSVSLRLAQAFIDACLDEQQSRTEAASALRDAGLDDWDVVVSVPFSAQRPCGLADVDAVERTIVIVAVQPRPEEGG
jgi:hypothetical protein